VEDSVQDAAIAVAREALYLALLVGAPVMVFSLGIGLVVSFLQATTQIHEQTLAFVPKIVATFAALFMFGPWMLTKLCEFTSRLLTTLPSFVR
jgi:flagellar biosynthetic protein FliQ